MTGPLGNHVAQQRLANERQVANQVQRLVPAAFVIEAKAAWIEHAAAVEADRIVQRRAANQAHVAHLVQLVLEPESPRRRNLRGIALRRHFHLHRLPADQRVLEPDLARQPERFVGQNRDALALVFHRYRAPDPQVAPFAPVMPETRALDQIDERHPTAIQNRNFQVIDLDKCVVDPHAVENTQQMFSRRNENALPHEARGIAHTGDIAADRLNLEAIQVSAPEHDPGTCGRGQEAEADRGSAMQSDSLAFDSNADCLFLSQAWFLEYVPSDYQFTGRDVRFACGK